MNLKNEHVEKFKKIYEEKNHRTISDSEALKYFEDLVTLVDIIYKPIRKKDYV